ncbi:hypothetical protein WT60_11715 [Burkholderia sp. MSMB617WGS]|uniref:Gp36 n=1 Tax=Burkholderia savannae TaxID=1637837 RepID=A0ABR5TEL7_9BURK|nr:MULTISPECIES: hypothetical protein [Burkholderia]AOK47436.1 hypothetical protein WT60_11715 [Burkholderia sp. MSMB617WGS]KWZ43445.1 hypothetical protein WS72_11635 [Burkholderia savannae]KWZ46466.1 hypothetical protein WS73_20760 [Burkholderia savannae]
MQSLFTMRGYQVDCTPRVTEDGQFAAQVTFTYIGYNPEAFFKNLGTYETEEAAVERARSFAVEWLARNG